MYPVATVLYEPTIMPWGNCSILFRDPDGNLVNLFTPVTPEAIERVGAPSAGAQAGTSHRQR